MAKIDPKVLLATKAPPSPGTYPVRVEFKIGRDDWSPYETLTADATLAWQDQLIKSYLGLVGLKQVNYGAKFCLDTLSPKDKRAMACAKALFVAEEAQADWSGKSRGDILFLRAALFATPSKRMCSAGLQLTYLPAFATFPRNECATKSPGGQQVQATHTRRCRTVREGVQPISGRLHRLVTPAIRHRCLGS